MPKWRDHHPADGKGLIISAIRDSVRKTGKLIIAHEAVRTGGAGAEVAQSVVEGAFEYLEAPIVRVASKDLPIPVGVLQDEVYPDAALAFAQESTFPAPETVDQFVFA